MRMVEKDGKMYFDCGCVAWKEGDKFYTRPHSFDCEVYKFILSESNRQFNRLEYRIER